MFKSADDFQAFANKYSGANADTIKASFGLSQHEGTDFDALERVFKQEVTESARACSFYSVSAGSNSGTPPAVSFLAVQSLAVPVYFRVL